MCRMTWQAISGRPNPPRAFARVRGGRFGLAEDARAQVFINVVAALQVVLVHAQLQGRTLKLNAELESSLSYFSFKR